jgi:phosphocarrier protein
LKGGTTAGEGSGGPLNRNMKVLNKNGIHARPAALFVKTAGRFACDIKVEKDGLEVSGKSIMGLLTLEGYHGSVLRVTASGEDAEEALDALETLVGEGFNEE